MQRIVLVFLILIAPILVIGQIPEPKPNTYVNDNAFVLSPEDIARLNERARGLESKYSVQLAIILVKQLPDNYSIEDYAREIGRKWHVGNAKNGLVYVAAIDQHQQRLEVAANLEGSIPDIVAAHLTDNIKPYFRSKDYAGGLLNMVKEIDEQLNPAIKEQQALAEAELMKKDAKGNGVFLILGLILLGSVGIGLLIYYFRSRKTKRKKEEVETNKKTEQNIASSNSGSTYIAPVYIDNSQNNYNNSSSKSEDNGSSYISSSSSNSSDSSSYGNWGSGSSDSSSSFDSGFSGGGSSNDW